MEKLLIAASLACKLAILRDEFNQVLHTKAKNEEAKLAKIKRLNEIKKAAEDLARQTN